MIEKHSPRGTRVAIIKGPWQEATGTLTARVGSRYAVHLDAHDLVIYCAANELAPESLAVEEASR